MATGETPAAPSATQKLVARPIVSARNKASTRPASLEITPDMPAGTTISGEYIVIYKSDVQDIPAAAADLQTRAKAAVAQAAASGTVFTASAESSVAVLRSTKAPAGVPSQAVIQVPAQLNPKAVRSALMASQAVKAVVQNRVVKVVQSGRSCYPPYYAAGVQGNPAPGITLTWQDCLTSDSKLALFGERCGAEMDKFRWTGIYAYNTATGQQVNNCVRLRSAETNSLRLAQMFGDCGVAPEYFANMPTAVCQEDASSACVEEASLPKYEVGLTRALCDGGAAAATFQGVGCGPSNSLILWNLLSPQGCPSVSRTSTDPKQQADWIGQCGVPPQQIVGIPTRVCGKVPGGDAGASVTPSPAPPAEDPSDSPNPPPSDGSKLPFVELKQGESANWGVSRVGAYDASRNVVVDVAAAVAATGCKVAVIDTGVDAGHPDINVVEFKDFVDGEGTSYYQQDGNGHGTHCAGIIAAKNNGVGMFGVVPGMPILALKVLSKEGSGPLDIVYQAYADVLARLGAGEKIVAINLSLSSQSTAEEDKQVECDWVRKMQAYGTAVVAAAGNDGEQLDYNLPASCSEALTVTSLTVYDNPSSFSNFASTDNDKVTSMLAAPGSSIYSTYKDGSYATLSGTSMATPFVVGACTQCFLVGRCQLSSTAGVTPAVTTNYPVVIEAAKSAGCNGNLCGPQWGSGSFYGSMVNVRPFEDTQ